MRGNIKENGEMGKLGSFFRDNQHIKKMDKLGINEN